jgi:hypothetical protein
MTMETSSEPSRAVQFWSFALPVVKCAVCPACLSLVGGLAGAPLGFLADERFHGGVVTAALVADFLILRAGVQHHASRWPLGLCLVGGVVVVVGHFTAETLELVGLGLLLLAAVQNVVLLRRRCRRGGSCCPHEQEIQLARPSGNEDAAMARAFVDSGAG